MRSNDVTELEVWSKEDVTGKRHTRKFRGKPLVRKLVVDRLDFAINHLALQSGA